MAAPPVDAKVAGLVSQITASLAPTLGALSAEHQQLNEKLDKIIEMLGAMSGKPGARAKREVVAEAKGAADAAAPGGDAPAGKTMNILQFFRQKFSEDAAFRAQWCPKASYDAHAADAGVVAKKNEAEKIKAIGNLVYKGLSDADKATLKAQKDAAATAAE
jgi:hypothetical protein